MRRVLRNWLCWFSIAVLCTGCNRGNWPFLHDQPLKWAPAVTGLPPDGMWKSTPVFADVNGDGIPDLIAMPRLGQGAHVWLGDGKGNWRDSSRGLSLPVSCGGGVAVGDLNKDGHPDLVVADHCAGVFVYLGDGGNNWTPVVQGLNPAAALRQPSSADQDNPYSGAEDVALGDVNEDGFLDLVVGARNEGGITVYFGDGSGKNWREAVNDGLPKTGFATNLILRDIDGDGHLDLIASYSGGPRVWHGDGRGHWKSYSQGLPQPTAGGFYHQIAVGDVNEDGRLDIAFANLRNGPELYLQTETETWQPAPPPLPAMKGGATGIALADLDRDGHLDMVIGGRRSLKTHYGLFVLRGDGKGGWTELRNTNLPTDGLTFIWGLALADIDGDGLPDLAVTTGIVPPQRQPDEAWPRMQVWRNRFPKTSPRP